MLQTISLSVYITSQHEVPLGSIFDVFFLAWILITISLILNLIKSMSFSVFFLNLIGLVLLTMSTFQPDNYSTHVEKAL